MLDRSLATQVLRVALLSLFVPLLMAGALFALTHIAPPDDLRVFGAASLKDAIDDANVRYQRSTGRRVIASYGASYTLAKQIENGAPADIFIPADIDCMDYLARHNLIKPDTRRSFLSNKLVLIANAHSATTLAIGPNFALAQALGNGRLAIGDPASVPAGRYGKAALEALGSGPRLKAGSPRPGMSAPRWSLSAAARRRSASFIRPTRWSIKAWIL
jgi:molybdate transport system substrate-binding protein